MEQNLVFELNGGVVRRAGELLSSVHHGYVLAERDMGTSSESFFSRVITDFLVDLLSGRGNIPPIAAAPVSR
jgi:hypothetical protein